MFLDAKIKTEPVLKNSETLEGDQLITEAILLDEGIILEQNEGYDLMNEGLLSEKTIIRMDKQAKRQRSTVISCLLISKEKGDPLWKKFVLLSKGKKKVRGLIVKKYINQAKSRVSKMMSNMQSHPQIQKLVKNKRPAKMFLKHKDLPQKKVGILGI